MSIIYKITIIPLSPPIYYPFKQKGVKALKTMAAVVLAALTLSLTGCSKDPEDLIIGTWLETEITMTVTESGRTQTESLLEEGMVVEMTMKEDNTYVTYSKYVDGDESTDIGT